ncbi:hypothetical protein B0H14DRAFT_1142827 [Mycena olivaceomarginata]|nr:hypothetical protein B0H14DRAFT_1142827 [Mycena olivaceomarginata]
MDATATRASVFVDGGVNKVPKPPTLIYADAELHKLLTSLYTHQPCVFQFDPSAVKDYVPSITPETVRTAEQRRHDRLYGVKHFLPSPSHSFAVAKYPSSENEQSGHGGMIPLTPKPSLECQLFGWDKDVAPPPMIRYSALPDPWRLPIVDAPLVICPQSIIQSSWAIAQSSNPRPPPVQSVSRTTKPLPLRALQNSVTGVAHSLNTCRAPAQSSPRPTISLPCGTRQTGISLPATAAQMSNPRPPSESSLPLRTLQSCIPLPPATPATKAIVAQPNSRPASRPTIPLLLRVLQNDRPPLPPTSSRSPSSSSFASESDYSAPGDDGDATGGTKRKAVNPPSYHPAKKSSLASEPDAPPAPSRPAAKPAPLKCGIDACPETFPNKRALQRHQQRHLHSRQRISCSGCPAAFGRVEDLHAHLAHHAPCTTENAARLLQMFYLQPEVIAINPAAAAQKDLMGYWRRFLEVVAVSGGRGR